MSTIQPGDLVRITPRGAVWLVQRVESGRAYISTGRTSRIAPVADLLPEQPQHQDSEPLPHSDDAPRRIDTPVRFRFVDGSAVAPNGVQVVIVEGEAGEVVVQLDLSVHPTLLLDALSETLTEWANERSRGDTHP